MSKLRDANRALAGQLAARIRAEREGGAPPGGGARTSPRVLAARESPRAAAAAAAMALASPRRDPSEAAREARALNGVAGSLGSGGGAGEAEAFEPFSFRTVVDVVRARNLPEAGPSMETFVVTRLRFAAGEADEREFGRTARVAGASPSFRESMQVETRDVTGFMAMLVVYSAAPGAAQPQYVGYVAVPLERVLDAGHEEAAPPPPPSY